MAGPVLAGGLWVLHCYQPEVAHRLVRSVVGDLRKCHSKRDVAVAARIVHEVCERICNDIFFVSPGHVDPEMN